MSELISNEKEIMKIDANELKYQARINQIVSGLEKENENRKKENTGRSKKLQMKNINNHEVETLRDMINMDRAARERCANRVDELVSE